MFVVKPKLKYINKNIENDEKSISAYIYQLTYFGKQGGERNNV